MEDSSQLEDSLEAFGLQEIGDRNDPSSIASTLSLLADSVFDDSTTNMAPAVACYMHVVDLVVKHSLGVVKSNAHQERTFSTSTWMDMRLAEESTQHLITLATSRREQVLEKEARKTAEAAEKDEEASGSDVDIYEAEKTDEVVEVAFNDEENDEEDDYDLAVLLKRQIG